MAARGWMTVAEVELRVRDVQLLDGGGDHEAAHSTEDALFRDVLRQCLRPSGRGGEPSARAMAQALEPLLRKEGGPLRWCG